MGDGISSWKGRCLESFPCRAVLMQVLASSTVVCAGPGQVGDCAHGGHGSHQHLIFPSVIWSWTSVEAPAASGGKLYLDAALLSRHLGRCPPGQLTHVQPSVSSPKQTSVECAVTELTRSHSLSQLIYEVLWVRAVKRKSLGPTIMCSEAAPNLPVQDHAVNQGQYAMATKKPSHGIWTQPVSRTVSGPEPRHPCSPCSDAAGLLRQWFCSTTSVPQFQWPVHLAAAPVALQVHIGKRIVSS